MDSSTAIAQWLDREWIRCKPWLEAALKYSDGTHTIDDVEAQIKAGRIQFWPGLNGAVVTEIQEYPQKTVLNVFLCGGDLRECLEMGDNFIEPWAKENGCTAVRQYGRKGWTRALLKHGWREVFFVMQRDFK